ncbi:zinc ribbon domain-containing protein [Lactococcus kimchii]|uniref:zinc ribbon domain-containing protein n=1 Tax=Lactococcus sp. S-13 TaxID=2507158 RepID=UPI0010234BD7|nr:zinc ribbon domain-containing protein [Lactococcus sp. S-13]RZI47864.1 hypothetical protein EQJ87_11385 [Lactococcus sp. S-13]
MFWNNLKSSKKVSYEVSDNLGLTDSEKQGIEVNKAFDDFVVTIESINQLLLRDEREAAFNVFKKNEKQTIYGLTLELPMPVSTDFYALLDNFNSNKPHAINIRPFEVEISNKEITENEEVEKVPVEENIQDEVNKEQIDDSQQKLRPFPDTLIAEKDAEIERLRKQINQSSAEDKEESEYKELAKSISRPIISTNTENNEHVNTFDEPSKESSSNEEEGQCAQCGFKNVEGARFCSSCGNSLSGFKATAAKEVPLSLEVLDEKVLEDLPSEFSKLFSLKEGWNIRPKIEHEVALEFEMKKDGILKKVQEEVETQKKEAIEQERQKFEEKETRISSEYAEKLTTEKNNAIIQMEQDKKDEIEKRIDLRRQYLNQWYRSGLAQLDGKQPIQEPLQVEG